MVYFKTRQIFAVYIEASQHNAFLYTINKMNEITNCLYKEVIVIGCQQCEISLHTRSMPGCPQSQKSNIGAIRL